MDWKRGPPVLVGEKVLWLGNAFSKAESGVIKWIGNIPEKSPDWCVGIELDVALPTLGGDGFWKERQLFECRSRHGLLVPIEEIQKLGSKANSKSISAENCSHFKLDDSQVRDLTLSNLRQKPHKEIKKTLIKNRYSNSGSKLIDEPLCNRTSDSGFDRKKENRNSVRELLGFLNTNRQAVQPSQDEVKSSQKNVTERKKLKGSETNSNAQNFFTSSKPYENSEDTQSFDSKTLDELMKNMNEIAGYFKEIKEGDDKYDKPEQANNMMLYEATEPGHSKPKKLFSFLKWFNKKHKPEPNLNLFKDSSATSSPMFPRRETSSCESIDTLFSTQTVRSFAYIPPTLYRPSAPPLDYERSSSLENEFEAPSQKNSADDIESIYERKKKRKAPPPPRLSRENSLPTTLEHKKNANEDFDGIKTYHRRTVSESFKDKKAGSYCHVQGKRKAPPPPATPLYPNLQKLNNQYPSLYKKKKPAPPPPEPNTENQNENKKEREMSQPSDGPKKEKPKDSKDNGNEQRDEKGMIINQTYKERLTKDASLSPLPSRPWYKRSHRDSTGSNIIKKDLLKGFEKKKNKESDDWMPEVGFPRRSLSTETHSKFNIFSKLEKTDDKKKEEKRKSQISILTNISELDREAAEIVRKEQAEEKKMIAANDAKYYSSKEIQGKNREPVEMSTNMPENYKAKGPADKNKPRSDKEEDKSNIQRTNRMSEPQAIVDHVSAKEVKTGETAGDLKAKEEILKDKENNLNPDSQSNGNPKQNLFSPNVLADLTNSSSQSPLGKITKPSQNPSQARLNFFNVQNKELNYLNEPWVCQKCTLENPGWRVFCEICSSVKPRFPNNSSAPKTTLATGKEIPKDEPLPDKPIEVKPDGENTNQTTGPDIPENEKEEVETLDELRQKRMTFFHSKLEKPEKTEPEPLVNGSKAKLQNIIKDLRESLPEENLQEEKYTINANKKLEEDSKKQVKRQENSATTQIKRDSEEKQVTESKNKERISVLKDEVSSSVVKNDKKETPQTVASEKSTRDESKEAEKVIEAYVVTKTIVLEDIIVKKPDRGKKVSASAQTKSSISPTSDAVRPPPRTKKIVFESTSEKETEPKSSPGKVLLNNEETYKQQDLEELTSKLTRAEGVADFRAKIETMPMNTEMNTVAVNRLLRKLEEAINCRDHCVAAGLAKELALMNINCSVTRQVTASPGTSKITIDLYIEDKLSHQGPIPLEVSPTMSLLQLKKKILQEFGIPLEVQRWILGKKLATDDNKTLESEGVKNDYCPLFLYLVAPDPPKIEKEASPKAEKNVEPPQAPTEENSGPKTKGWYYNHEEDHYSYCEDSEDSNGSDTDTNSNAATERDMENKNVTEPQVKKTEPAQEVKKPEKPPVFDLKSREAENDVDKELKFISANSVKQKVEQLNKTFAANARAVKPPLRSSRSPPETWKCGSCNIVNSPGRQNCFSCNAKKLVNDSNNTKIYNEKKEEPLRKEIGKTKDDNIHYKALMQLQDADLVPNSEPFSCSICLVDFAVGEGVTLKDCLHTFCRTCLIGTVQYSEEAEVKCPYFDNTYSCQSVLQQREIKALVPQVIFELHLAKSVKEAENKIGNAFHCKTPDCKGWCIYEDNVNQFRCPVCRSTNCLTCQAIHNGINCREYQERMKEASETDVDAKKTRDMLNEMVEKGEAMACPKCQVVLMKKWGCDWLKCSMCKTEICWVTRGFRWGPEGKGDTSGGCKCGVNGVKCHPKCNYCH